MFAENSLAWSSKDSLSVLFPPVLLVAKSLSFGTEWVRVRCGECAFRISRNVSSVGVCALFLSFLVSFNFLLFVIVYFVLSIIIIHCWRYCLCHFVMCECFLFRSFFLLCAFNFFILLNSICLLSRCYFKCTEQHAVLWLEKIVHMRCTVGDTEHIKIKKIQKIHIRGRAQHNELK